MSKASEWANKVQTRPAAIRLDSDGRIDVRVDDKGRATVIYPGGYATYDPAALVTFAREILDVFGEDS